MGLAGVVYVPGASQDNLEPMLQMPCFQRERSQIYITFFKNFVPLLIIDWLIGILFFIIPREFNRSRRAIVWIHPETVQEE